MLLKFVIVTVSAGVVIALLSFIKTPKEVIKEFFKGGFWIMMGTFVLLYLLALFLHHVS